MTYAPFLARPWRVRERCQAMILALAALGGLIASSALAQGAASTAPTFEAFKSVLDQEAQAAGISSATRSAVIPTLMFQPRVVALDRAQPGGAPNGPVPKFAPYRATHVDSGRITRGRSRYLALRPLLQRVEAQTGVPEAIMIAIYGHETNYGSFTGNFDLPNVLATLAYEGRRRDLFLREFIATLKLMDQGYPRTRMRGSWAGATGYPQFLPSVYLRDARDGDGDGRADIWTNEADALASIANYFAKAGWRQGQPWAVSASISAPLDWAALAPRVSAPSCTRVHARHSQWKTVAQWAALGVRPTREGLSETDLVSLFQPDGPGTPAWLLTGNYRVILDYNCSNFYALSVGLLADAVDMDKPN